MRIIELTDKLSIPLTNEEHSLLKKFSSEQLSKQDLSPREQILANQLTVKNVLLRINDNGKIYYKKQIN
jgi:hypothetical protein